MIVSAAAMSTTHIYHQEGGRKLSVIWNQRYTHMPASAKLHSCYFINKHNSSS